MAEDIALSIQRLPGPMQALVMTDLAARRSEAASASTREVLDAFESLRLPPPSNASATLARLAKKGLVTKRGTTWRLTPEGDHLVARTVRRDALHDTRTSPVSGATFDGARHYVVPHTLAPSMFRPGTNQLVDRYGFDKNVFLITRFPRDIELDPVAGLAEPLRAAVAAHDLVLHLASDRKADDGLLGNVGAHLWACKYGIVVLEDRVDEGLNHNVLIELGAMLITGRRCIVLKDRTAPERLPTDIVDRIYEPVDLDDPATVIAAVHRWVADDLSLGTCADCAAGNGGSSHV